MTPLVRQIVLLLAVIVMFFIVLGALLWGHQLAATHHNEPKHESLVLSRTHLAQALRSLVTLRIDLYEQSVSPRAASGVPYRFEAVSTLDNLDLHVGRVARLANNFDYRNAFNLPSRARQQLKTARDALRTLDKFTPQSLALLDPLQDTLEQLERIYEIEERVWADEHSQYVSHSMRYLILGTAFLVLMGGALIAHTVLALRNTLHREFRVRNDLEEAKRNLEVLAMYDNLTELGNRHMFKARLEQAIGSSGRSERFSALMYIDLDNFKRINDSLGHDAGDEVLKIVAIRLKDSVRASDTVTRIGGDEFTVIATDMANRENAGFIAATLMEQINQPIRLANNEVVVSASIGITLIPTDGQDSGVLLKNADMALYRAKERGRHNFQFFSEAMNRAIVAQMDMENALRVAAREADFTLHYQPQLDLVSGELRCLEALLRWRRADGTMVRPDQFIPVADATGLVMEIGGWVFMQACKDLVSLRRCQAPDLRMSVNLSARQFGDPNLLARIRQALEANELPPQALEVEITETTLVEDLEATVMTLGTLRDMGVTVAIDDFGIGYSSLNYLKNLPIDSLKIDRSFVRDIETDEADRSIVDAILAMTQSLSLRSVAEGIETEWQLDYLSAQRCDLGQGFLLSRPVPLEALSVEEIGRRWSSAQVTRARRGMHVVE